MIITVPPHLESALAAQAQRHGVTPEVLALQLLRDHLLLQAPLTPIDDWEEQLVGAAVDCGVSVTDTVFV